MKLTPLDIGQHTFRKAMRGYDPRQVEDFLALIRMEWEALLREIAQQKETLVEMQDKIHQYQEKERTLQETLVTAQRLTEDLKQSAKKEAETTLGEAELQADKIIHQAHGRLTEIIDEINELKRQRAKFEGELRGILETHVRLIDLHKDARETSKIETLSILSKAT